MNEQEKNILYAVIDTNVIISALLSKKQESATVLVVEKLLKGEFIPVFSKEILQEYRTVLRRKKFSFSEELVDIMVTAVEKLGETIEPVPVDEVLPDRKDQPFYEVVLAKEDESAYLVTGNIKHFPQKPMVVTPREFLNILNEKTET